MKNFVVLLTNGDWHLLRSDDDATIPGVKKDIEMMLISHNAPLGIALLIRFDEGPDLELMDEADMKKADWGRFVDRDKKQ